MAERATATGKQRLFIFAGILALWVLVILSRLIYLQIFHYGDFVQRAQRQQQRTIEVEAPRGIIYDRNGHELAMSMAVDSVFAVPSEVPDQPNAAQLLGGILQVDPQEILTHFRSSRAFCWVARKLDPQVSARLRALNLKGIYFQKESKRFYPKRELAAQVLGYVGLDDEGLGGLERSFEPRLKGKPGKMLISLDARRRWFGRVERQPDAGQNLLLTLDEKIQYIAERELQNAMRQTHAAAGTVIVQNPHSGEILALANSPSFDPNVFHNANAQSLKNRAVSDVYEPGSTFKIVTLAAALEEKLTTPEELVDCQNGAINIGGMRIRDHKPFGTLTVAQVLANSSDVGAIKVGLRLGEERLYQYVRAFGFGSQTGIELPGETRGLTKPVSRWSKVSIGAISMGQEIGISPLQLASLISTIANDGNYTPPRVVAGVMQQPQSTAKGLAQVVFHPAQQRRVISTMTAAQMKKMLEGVVLFGTGRKAIIDGYSSAGKTGTAQKVDPATGAYSRSRYVASFAGFAPVNNPAISVAVILDSPVGPHEGGQVSAPVFARVAQQVLAYLNVPHDAEVTNRSRQMLRAANKVSDSDIAESSPDHLGDAALLAAEEKPAEADVGAAKLLPASVKLVSRSAPDPPPLSPTSTAPLPAARGGTVIVDVGAGVEVPALTGLSVRAALETAQEAGIELDVIGSGVAREQSPSPGSHVLAGGHVAVRFTR